MENVIKFETNIQEYSLNDRVSIVFSPTDIHFIEEVLTTFDEIVSLYDEYQSDVKQINGDDPETDAAMRIYDIAHKADADIRGKINSVFGKDVCTPTIGGRSILMPAGGLPVWANMLLAIIDKFDAQLVEEKKKTNSRISQYTEKYKKRQNR